MIAHQPNPVPSPHEPPQPPAAPDSHFTHSPLSSLTPSQLSILEQLATGADPAALAVAHNLSLAALALWVREPRVGATLDAFNDLLALHRAAWRHQVVKDTVESLREVMQNAETLPERRRAATQIIRALSSIAGARRAPSPAPRGGGGRVFEAGGGHEGHRARSASEGQRERSASGGQRARSASEGQRARSASEGPPSEIPNPRFEIAPSPSRPALNTSPLSPLDNLADHIIAALESDDPVIINAVRDLRGGAADESDSAARALDEGIQRLIEALPGATVTSSPAVPDSTEPDSLPPPRPAGEVAESSRPERVTSAKEPEAQARVTGPDVQARATDPDAQASLRATKLYTLAYADAPPLHFLLRVGCNPASNDCWLEEILSVDST